MSVLCQHISGEVVVLVLAVQQQQIAKCLWREGILLEEELQFLESLSRTLFHVHQGLVVQGHGVELFLGSENMDAKRT